MNTPSSPVGRIAGGRWRRAGVTPMWNGKKNKKWRRRWRVKMRQARWCCGWNVYRLPVHILPAMIRRLGASLANVGLATLNDKREEAVAMLQSARNVWAYSAAWIDRMTPEQRARSSPHHFRLEQKKPPCVSSGGKAPNAQLCRRVVKCFLVIVLFQYAMMISPPL